MAGVDIDEREVDHGLALNLVSIRMRQRQEAICRRGKVVVTCDALAEHVVFQHNFVQPRVARVVDVDVKRRSVTRVAARLVDTVGRGDRSEICFQGYLRLLRQPSRVVDLRSYFYGVGGSSRRLYLGLTDYEASIDIVLSGAERE